MKNDLARALAKFSQVGICMLIPILMCIFIGKWLDKKFGTNILFLIIFTIIGVGAAFRNLYVIVIKEYNKEEKIEDSNR